MPKHIVLLSGNYPPETGGPAKFVESFSVWLRSNGFSVSIISTTPLGSTSFNDKGVDVSLVSRRLPLMLRYLKTAIKVIRKSNRDSIILANGCLMEVLLIGIIGRRNYFIKLPGDVVWEQARASGRTDLSMDDFQKSKLRLRFYLLRKLSTLALNRSSKILVPSTIMKSVCIGWGLDPEKIRKVYNSVDPSNFLPSDLNAKFDLITVSRLISIKRIDEIIVVAKKLDCSLLIVGEGPMMDPLMLLSDKLGGKVTFYGNASQAIITDLYDQGKIFILNSEFEAGTPYALLEARSKGLICIGRENTGCEDIIHHEIDGFLCGKKSGLDLERALIRALELSEFEKREFRQRAASDTSVRFAKENIFRIILKEIGEDEF